MSQFTRLEYLWLEDNDSMTENGPDPQKGLIVARQLFQSCPTLRRISFHIRREEGTRSRQQISFHRTDDEEPAFEEGGGSTCDPWLEL